eukprot:1933613-Rhodomonas_salina.1
MALGRAVPAYAHRLCSYANSGEELSGLQYEEALELRYGTTRKGGSSLPERTAPHSSSTRNPVPHIHK